MSVKESLSIPKLMNKCATSMHCRYKYCSIPVSLVDAFEEALRHLAGLDDDRPELPRHVHDVGLGRAHHMGQALSKQGKLNC